MIATINLNSRTHITCEGTPEDLAKFIIAMQNEDTMAKKSALDAEIERCGKALQRHMDAND